ncbi:MAG: peptide chain release factor N(5)-glutamine methyltransferase [Anaerolineaceae bacterium]
MTTKTDLQTWISQATHSLVQSESPFLEVQVIAANILCQSREWVIAHADFQPTSEQLNQLNAALTRLVNGEPLAYIIGKQSFYGLDFIVTPAVLIPRPETELLVEEAIHWLELNPRRRNVVDVGTGSGVIAITLADVFLDLKITAIDISEDALKLSQQNAVNLQVNDLISWQKNDLLSNLSGKFDLILANLPYIPTETLNSLDVIKFEPRLALDGGSDGLNLIRKLLMHSPEHLLAGGVILLEIESTLSNEVLEISKGIFPAAKIDLIFDYANLPRLVKIQE